MNLQPLQYPSDQNVMGFNVLIPCAICRTPKKPFQVGERWVTVIREKKSVEVSTGDHYCLDCREPFFTSPEKRKDTYDKLKKAQARLGITSAQ